MNGRIGPSLDQRGVSPASSGNATSGSLIPRFGRRSRRAASSIPRSLASPTPATGPGRRPGTAGARRGRAGRRGGPREPGAAAESKLDPGRTRAVAGGVGEGFLQDSASSLIGGALERLGYALTGEADIQACGAVAGDQRVEGRQPQRRGCGPVGRPGVRRVPTTPSISAAVCRAISSVVSSAACERSGSCRRRAAPPRTVITLSPCH